MFRSTKLLTIGVAAAVAGAMLPGPATATPQAKPAVAATSLEVEAIRLTNRAREKHGCDALRTNGRLVTAARRHSADMARNNFFSHTGSDGSNFAVRAKRAGYRHAMGENIAQGQRTAAEVVRAWMGSDEHRRIILDCSAKAIGVGLARDRDRGGALLWTQVFGRA